MREGWEEVTLGELLSLEYGKALPAKSRVPGDVTVYGSNGIVGTHNFRLVQGPGIVVGRKGTAGSVTWSDSDFFPIDTTYWAKVDRSKLSIEFAFHVLCNSDLPRLNTQTGVPGLNRENVYRELVALPPLHEQRRIVDLMDSVDAAISAAQVELDAAEELRKRVLGHELGSPGEGWEATSIGDAIQVNPKMGKLDASAPFVTMSDVDEWGTYAYPSGEKGSRGGIRAQGGDVLFARITPCLENGKIGKLPDAAPPTGGSTEFIVLRGTEKTTSDFAFLLAQSDYVHSSAVALMTGSTGRQRVAASDVANIPINLPPLHEQCRIVETMNTLDGTVDASRASLDRLRELRSSMLSVLLSGEHEIPATYDQFLGLSDDERAG